MLAVRADIRSNRRTIVDVDVYPQVEAFAYHAGLATTERRLD